MFPLPISTYIYIAIALGTAFITHRIDGYYTEKAKVEAVEHAIAMQTKIVQDQGRIQTRLCCQKIVPQFIGFGEVSATFDK